ncbi:hypothetical protein BD324DRAFT_607169 [Kockovaella imperatae]|uniref:DUF3835 domain-containing protein n=1 Tax=Kockovaella imperatae TaxID=4999 RepID=A0A1Y1URC6_9TREE|nr:hypothetical protein BD324DRAFT_607169 [Kockovaella imperatae]ORX40044.1 hypothetical protein BD324DRAFT_607169 [Kockovaella imperatae]
MENDQSLNTIRPSDPSVEAQIQALDLLSARLKRLTDQTRWPARVPLNAKASLGGQVVHTNDVKVNIGAGYWVGMTAQEASEWVQRRKTDMLFEHARRMEGRPNVSGQRHTTISSGPLSSSLPLSLPLQLNPIFSTSIAGPYKARSSPPPASLPTGQTTGRLDPVGRMTVVNDKDNDEEEAEGDSLSGSTLGSAPNSGSGQGGILADVVQDFVEAQKLQAGTRRDGQESVLVNEEGLPIHEIREGLDGSTLGDPPPSMIGGDPLPDFPPPEEKEDYWSEDAKARRAALRRKVFNEGTDSDDDSDADTALAKEQVTPDASAKPSPSLSPGPHSPARPSLVPTPSASTPGPTRSILKPQVRKKSVTFDDSVPLPSPDSPDSKTIHAGGMGFPLPIHDVSDERTYGEFQVAPVPMLNQPTAPKKGTSGTGAFAGFRPGFLSSRKPIVAQSAAGEVAEPVGQTPKPKQSLFAQRRAAKTSHAEESRGAEPSGSNLPLMSKTPGMMSVKNTVVEKAPVPSVQPVQSLASSSGTTLSPGSTSHSRTAEVTHVGDDSDAPIEDMDDEEDIEEDEYDLDDALLAREIALDYHRRQQPIRPRSEHDEDTYDFDHQVEHHDENDDDDGGEEGAGVMLALPSISNGRIINPSPDELRKYVRVGRLENGNLVLAPGEEGWSDDEDGDAKARREEVKRQLLGQSGPTQQSSNVTGRPPPAIPPTSRRTVREKEDNMGMPPAVRTVKETQSIERNRTVEEETAAPKKMSRFKAARLGLDV